MNQVSESMQTNGLKYDWKIEEVERIYYLPLLELVYKAATVHRLYHDPTKIQVCRLLSIKTGGCSEDCAYCSQSVHYQTNVEVHKLLSVEEVVKAAKKAKESGATRFCMGAAWREVRNNRDFDTLLEMIRAVKELGLEVCATFGMATPEQLKAMKEAGLYAYNHNLDTSPDYYSQVITTRTYEERLNTLKAVREVGLTVCCGGIIGMGESEKDRIKLLHILATMNPHPESVPVNNLVPIPGTPLEKEKGASIWELVRMIATARILMPRSKIRLSAGRERLSPEAQALCFLAGANSIFSGERLLTAPNVSEEHDAYLFQSLGLVPEQPYSNE